MALQPFNILVRSTNWLGDAVMSAPAVMAIKRGRPDARVTILTREKLADFWREAPGVDDVISMGPKDSVFATAEKLKGRFHAAVLFPNSVRAALEARIAGIPTRVGYPAKWRRLLLTESVHFKRDKKAPQPPAHQIFHYLDMAKFIGAHTEKALPEEIPSTPRMPGQTVKIGLCPGADYGPAKRWLPERFAEAARLVAEKTSCEWLLFGTEKDARLGEEIATAIAGKCSNLMGKTTLAELMGALRECSLLLTNDTGTMHLAAFLNVPTVAIFGSTEPSLTGPLGTGNQILRHHVECSPCFLRECPLDFRCMKAVEVDEVVQNILRMLPAQN